MGVIKRAIAIILCILLVMSATTAFAAETQLTEGNYVYEVKEGEAFIKEYKGTDKNVVIPPTLGGCPVTTINISAFEDNKTIESLDVGNVKEICSYAFEGCVNLTSVNLRNVEKLGSRAFTYCDKLESVEIPKSVKKGGLYDSGAFKGSNLEKVTFENGTTIVPESICGGCHNLKEIVLNDTITEIGPYAFANCDKLTTISFPDSITTIGACAFEDCDNLQDVTLPIYLENMGYEAFCYCDKITSIVIPKTYKNTLVVNNGPFNNSGLQTVEFEEGTTDIAGNICEGAINLTEIIFPDTVTKIGVSAFEDCTSLKDISIPNTVNTIERSAFDGCKSIEKIEMPNSVQTIQSSAFKGCTSLAALSLPEGLTTLDSKAFGDCTALTTIVIPSTLKSDIYMYSGGPFKGSGLQEARFANGTTKVMNWLFDGCKNLTTVVLNDTITTIGESAFKDCTNLVTMPDMSAVTEIKNSAFEGCTKLKNIKLPEQLTTIESMVFFDCTSLTQLKIPENVININIYAFESSGLTEIELPVGVQRLSTGAFNGCKNLANVTINAGIEAIYAKTFGDCPSLKNVVLPYTVELIAKDAFKNDTSLKTLTIPRYCTIIEDNIISYPQKTTIRGVVGTEAEAYAKKIGATFEAIDIPATSVKFKTTAITLKEQEEAICVADVYPLDFTDEVKWTSSDNNVATVLNGYIRAKNNGTTTITMTAGNVKATLTVTVKDAQTENPFTDVKSNKWYYTSVIAAYEAGLLLGTSKTEFSPETPMTRAMLVSVLYRVDENPSVAQATNPFSDVPAGKWYTNAVIWASTNNIVSGDGHGKFNPNGYVTREQIAAIIYRYAKFHEEPAIESTDLSKYEDEQEVSKWAYSAMEWANAVGIISGTSESGNLYLRPLRNASRAEVAAVILRYLNK